MSLWNGKKKEVIELNNGDNFTEEDDFYILQKKVDALINDQAREVALLKEQIHANTVFLQQIILELIAKGTTPAVRSSSVPLGSAGNVNTQSVKELVKNAKTAGPAGILP